MFINPVDEDIAKECSPRISPWPRWACTRPGTLPWNTPWTGLGPRSPHGICTASGPGSCPARCQMWSPCWGRRSPWCGARCWLETESEKNEILDRRKTICLTRIICEEKIAAFLALCGYFPIYTYECCWRNFQENSWRICMNDFLVSFKYFNAHLVSFLQQRRRAFVCHWWQRKKSDSEPWRTIVTSTERSITSWTEQLRVCFGIVQLVMELYSLGGST